MSNDDRAYFTWGGTQLFEEVIGTIDRLAQGVIKDGEIMLDSLEQFRETFSEVEKNTARFLR